MANFKEESKELQGSGLQVMFLDNNNNDALGEEINGKVTGVKMTEKSEKRHI